MALLMMVVLAMAAVAGDKWQGKGAKLFLFQKCDEAMYLDGSEQYDELGCPTAEGPWPIMFQNRRWGQMQYNLVGDTFRFSFQGKRLAPDTDYTLIYYPDPWPGSNLICLGEGSSNQNGNLQIHGEKTIETGLPAPYDANYYAGGIGNEEAGESGAVGAKIWLVPTIDVDCGTASIDGEDSDTPSQMIGWSPSSYLFEGNLITYQYSGLDLGDMGIEEIDPEELLEEGFEGFSEEYSGPAHENNGKAKGKDK